MSIGASMRLSAEQLASLAPLLEEGLSLDEPRRATWVDGVAEPFSGAREVLRRLLSAVEPDAVGREAGAPIHEADSVIDDFRLVREIGRGGMGRVWLAEQLAPVRRLVALKLIAAGMYDATMVQRFQKERQSLAIMDHPTIAKVFDAGTTPQGQPYFVMEYVPGIAITDYCDEKRLTIAQRLELFIQACGGVQHAHQKAVIHRDLKPANLLVVEVDGKPVPRIIDFGMAKPATPEVSENTLLTRFGQFIGTPGYMSPEQVDPNIRDIDTRTDVYSLGVILYQLLTGAQPFESNNPRKPAFDEWVRTLRELEPPRPSRRFTGNVQKLADAAALRGTGPKQLQRDLGGDLDWITMKALERDRERRYATPLELAADLRRHLNHQLVTARPVSAGTQVLKFARRHRIATAFIGTVSVLAVVASAAAIIAVEQERAAEHQTTETLKAQARLLTMAAAQRLVNHDVTGAEGIILEVLTGPEFAHVQSPAAVSVFEEIRAADQHLAILAGHRGPVYSARYSPDGERIVTASDDKTARIWDARTGIPLVMLQGHGGSVYAAAYSPDGTRIVTASDDKTARIWDARTGMPLVVLQGHDGFVYCAAYSPDGTRIVTASDDNTARVWDARTGALLRVLPGHGDRVNAAAYSPDGTRIVTASNDKTARIWDARSGTLLRVLSGHADLVESAVYSPDGMQIVTASNDKTVRLWDAGTGASLAILRGHGATVFSAAYSPDGTRIVTASADKTARIWDAGTAIELGVLSGFHERVRSANYSPDGTRIVVASTDMTVKIWATHPVAELAVLTGHAGKVGAASFSPDGTHIVTASFDKSARIWDSRTGVQTRVLSGHPGMVISAAYSPDGTRIVTASADRTARIWNARTGEQLAVLTGHAGYVMSAAFSPDGQRILTASLDKTAAIADANTGSRLVVFSGHTSFVISAAYSPDGSRIVTASSDKTARIWDARTGAQLAVLSTDGSSINSATYSPDGTRIVAGLNDKTARIWDSRSAVLLAVLAGHGDVVESAVYSPDGTRIVTASSDKTARIWDAGTGVPLAVLAGHEDWVLAAAYSPDGTRIVTASHDKTARIWDARIPADLASQILWNRAAQADPLPAVERIALGLPPDHSLGRSFETGSPGADADLTDAGEPHALARFAERAETQALAESDPQKTHELLLRAFAGYAAAAERAHDEDWPDDLWRQWRYRRATLARLLASQGMMRQVAASYAQVLARGRHQELAATP